MTRYLSMALAGRFTDHHALMCRLHLDRIKLFDDAVEDLDPKIAPLVARHPDAAALRHKVAQQASRSAVAKCWCGAGPIAPSHPATTTSPNPGSVPLELHQRPEKQGRADRERRRRHQAAAGPRPPGQRSGYLAGCKPGSTGWSASSAGPKNKGAQKRAITAIAHTLLKIAHTVLKSGEPYQDLAADF